MRFRNNCVAYLIGFHDHGTFVDAGIYDGYPTSPRKDDCCHTQKLLLSASAHNWETAVCLLRKFVGERPELAWVHRMRTMRLQAAQETLKARSSGMGKPSRRRKCMTARG